MQKFLTPWHQDYWYSQSAESSVVVWFPLSEISAEMGFLKAVSSPSNYGIIKFKEYTSGSEPFEPVDKVDESSAVELGCSFGSVLIFSQLLLHKSENNLSDVCRVSCQLRYNDMYKQSIPFSSFVAKHSDYVLERQKDGIGRLKK